MPIYEYQCEACSHQFDALQKLSDATLSDCPACHASRLRKLVSAAGFRLKGSGWYETDFKSGSKKNVVEGEKSATADGGAAASHTCGSGCSHTAKPAATAAE